MSRKYGNSDTSIESSSKFDPKKNVVRGEASWVMAAFLLVNASLGAGLLNYPVAYDRLGGIGLSTIVQVIILLMLGTTMFILIYCADLNDVYSYHDVLESMCGKRVKQMAASSIMITCFGICVTFLIIIGDQFDRIFATFLGPKFCYKWYSNRIFTITFTAIVSIWPMCYFRRLDFLRYANILGIFATLYVVVLNVYEYYKLDVIPGPIKTYPDSIVSVFAALPVICFAYQTHEIVVPVYACMADRKIFSFVKATVLALSLLFVLYCISGTYGYLTFGGSVAPDIMQMYNAEDPIVTAGIIALIIKMITTYPPVIFCGRDTFVGLFCKQTIEQSFNDELKLRVLITSAWNIICLILSIVTPNITIAIGFLGSLAACNVFVFPGLCMVSLAKRNSKLSSKQVTYSILLMIYGVIIILTGVFMFVIILVQVVSDLQADNEHGVLCV